MTRRRRGPLAKYDGFNIVANADIVDDNSPRVKFIIYLFQCPCNSKFSEWESPVLGAENGEVCKNSRCRNNMVLPYGQVEGLTPCQVPDKRVFGSFQCHRCRRFWWSAHSWANTSQKCQICNIDIYPFDQNNLQRGQKNPNKIHQRPLCQKCNEIGRDCSKIPTSNINRRCRTRPGRQNRQRNSNQVNALNDAMGALVINNH